MKRKVTIVAILVAFLGVVTVWWLSSSASRKVDDAKQKLSEEIAEQMAANPETSHVSIQNPDSLKDLAPEQVREVTDQMVPDLMSAMYDKFDRILKMPPDEQRKTLDEIIDEQVANAGKLRDSWNDSGRPMATGVTRRVVQRGPDADGAEAETTEQVIDSSTDEGQRALIDMTTPEQRAIMSDYVELLRERMKARGIDPKKVPISMSMSFESESGE